MEQEPAYMVYSEEQYLEAIRANAPATTKEVADTVGVTRQGADYRLRKLEDAGLVSSELFGNTLIWSVENAPERRESPVTPSEPSHDQSPVESEAPATPGEQRPEPTPTLEVDVESVDVPGSGGKAERRRQAIAAAVEYIREHGEATPAELQDDVYPEHNGDYTRGGNPPRSWWKNCVYPGLRQIAENDDRLEKADTTGRWSWDA